MSLIPFAPFGGDDVWIFSAFQRFSFQHFKQALSPVS